MKTLIPSQWAVPKRFRERVGESAGRQRQMTCEGHLLLVLHAVPEPGNPERTARLFWRDKTGAWKSAGQGTGVGPLRTHVTEFEEAVDRQETHLRTATTATEYFDVLKAATPLHRTSRNLLHTLQEAREAIDDRELINLRDRAGEIERASELLVAEARAGLDFTSAQQAEAQSKVSLQLARDGHKLNTIAAVFLPITALASIFSMTLRSGLETWFSPWFFWVIVGAGVLLGFTLKARVAPAEQPVEPVKARRALVRVGAEA